MKLMQSSDRLVKLSINHVFILHMNNLELHIVFEADRFANDVIGLCVRRSIVIGIIGMVGNFIIGRFLFRLAHSETVGTQYQSEIGTGNERRCATSADERERLTGDGNKIYRNCHVDKCLDRQNECRSQHQIFGKELPGFACNHSRPDEQHHIEQQHKHAAQKTQLFDDDGINEIGICLWEKIALGTVAGKFSE